MEEIVFLFEFSRLTPYTDSRLLWVAGGFKPVLFFNGDISIGGGVAAADI